MATALEHISEYEDATTANAIVDALEAGAGVALGDAGLWIGWQDEQGVHLTLVAC